MSWRDKIGKPEKRWVDPITPTEKPSVVPPLTEGPPRTRPQVKPLPVEKPFYTSHYFSNADDLMALHDEMVTALDRSDFNKYTDQQLHEIIRDLIRASDNYNP